MRSDPIFKGVKVVSGPQSIHVFQLPSGRWVYIIGENHEADGGATEPAVHEVIAAFGQKNPLHIWLETKDAMSRALSVRLGSSYGNPIDMMCYELLYSTKFHPNVKVYDADCRQKKPYDILELLYNKENFLFRYKGEFFGNREQFNERWKHIKEFEKHLFANLSNRNTALRFMRSLVYPERDFPGWYERTCKNLETGNESEEPTFDMKERLRELHKNHSSFYNKLIAYVEERWDSIVNKNETHSPLMKSMERRRKTIATSLAKFQTEPTRNTLFEDYYATLFGILLDIEFSQALADADANLENVPIVYFVGNAHALAMADFISRMWPECEIAWSAYSRDVHQQPVVLSATFT